MMFSRADGHDGAPPEGARDTYHEKHGLRSMMTKHAFLRLSLTALPVAAICVAGPSLPVLPLHVLSVQTVAAQAPPAPAAPANLQAPRDPRYAGVIAACKTPPPQAAGRAGGGPRGAGAPGAGGGGQRQGAPPAAPAAAPAPTAPPDYTITAIPGVIAAGGRWTPVYSTTGNNADGPLASPDGGLLIAQNDNGTVLKLDPKGQATVAFRDTNTGGALARSTTGALFVASRGIGTAVLQLEPERRVLANRFNGDPLECLGGVLNDVAADSRGGVYFTMGGLFYADAKGNVTQAQYAPGLTTNGVILSPDEKTLYVTNGRAIVAFEVGANGALANGREFATVPRGSGDGLAVDAAGRLYVAVGVGAVTGVAVFAPDGQLLGTIDSPRPLITVAFSGPDKKTLYGIANDRVRVDVYTIPMLAQGLQKRAK